MSIFKKLLFWKNDDLDSGLGADPFPNDPNLNSSFPKDDLGVPDSLGSPDYGNLTSPQTPPYGQSSPPPKPGGFGDQQNYMQQQVANRDLELISSKLDTIKALLQSLDQRTSRLEGAAGIRKDPNERLW